MYLFYKINKYLLILIFFKQLPKNRNNGNKLLNIYKALKIDNE